MIVRIYKISPAGRYDNVSLKHYTRFNRKDRTLKGKTLVVNDEASIRELFSTVFTEADHEVIAAEGGKRATTN